MKYFLALILTAACAAAATLNVPSQYATVQLAVNAAQPGDTVVIAAGTYDEVVSTVRNGTSESRITIDGGNRDDVIIKRINLGHDYHTIRNIRIQGENDTFQGTLRFGLGADYNIVQDCIVDSRNKLKTYGIFWVASVLTPDTEASYNVIERTNVLNVSGYSMLAMAGRSNTVRYCLFTECVEVDFIRLFGVNNHIHDNQFLNNQNSDVLTNHPDFIQTFGDNGERSYGHIIERNIINGIESGQMFQFSATGQADVRDWTFRNNIFANAALGGGGSVPGLKFYNNIFYRLRTGLSFSFRTYAFNTGLSSRHPLYAATTVPTASGDLVAEGDGGVYQYGGAYRVVSTEYQPGDALIVGKTYQARTRNTGRIVYNGVQYRNTETFTVVEGVTTHTEIGDTAFDLQETKLYAFGTITYMGTEYARDAWFKTDASDRTFTSTWPEAVRPWRVVVDLANRCEVKGNVFLECGSGGGNNGWYSFDLRTEDCEADYNYVAGPGFVAKTQDALERSIGDAGGWDGYKWWEDNGINGGNPSFTDASNLDFRLQPGSILIDQGVMIAGVTSDFINTVRPLGAAPDIGAYEYDDGSPPPDPPAPGTPPTAPSGLSATAGSSSTILLEWTDNANDEAYFELDRSLNGSSWTTTNQIDADTTAHVVAGLNASTLYYFRLRAVNGDGNSAYTATASATTQAPPVVGTPPTAPSNFQTTAIGAHSIAMAWDDNSADETGFQIDCSPDGTSWSTIANLAANMESWTNSGLAAATTYYYRVRAVNQYGNSAWSNDDATTTAATPPDRPARSQSARGDLIGQ